jgi:cytidylate kinase
MLHRSVSARRVSVISVYPEFAEWVLSVVEMKRKLTIAIDGPAGSGKTTIAHLVARRLGLVCVETGAMYRAVAWQARKLGIAAEDARALAEMTQQTELRLEPLPDGRARVLLSGRDITDELRSPELEQLASRISTHGEVRRRLVALQRGIAAGGGVVVEGRDIQTVVLPDAEVKIFLTASSEERARRRMKDLEAAGRPARFEDVLASVRDRDARDRTRDASPLRPAPDAAIINTDGMTIEEVVGRVVALANGVT